MEVTATGASCAVPALLAGPAPLAGPGVLIPMLLPEEHDPDDLRVPTGQLLPGVLKKPPATASGGNSA